MNSTENRNSFNAFLRNHIFGIEPIAAERESNLSKVNHFGRRKMVLNIPRKTFIDLSSNMLEVVDFPNDVSFFEESLEHPKNKLIEKIQEITHDYIEQIPKGWTYFHPYIAERISSLTSSNPSKITPFQSSSIENKDGNYGFDSRLIGNILNMADLFEEIRYSKRDLEALPAYKELYILGKRFLRQLSQNSPQNNNSSTSSSKNSPLNGHGILSFSNTNEVTTNSNTKKMRQKLYQRIKLLRYCLMKHLFQIYSVIQREIQHKPFLDIFAKRLQFSLQLLEQLRISTSRIPLKYHEFAWKKNLSDLMRDTVIMKQLDEESKRTLSGQQIIKHLERLLTLIVELSGNNNQNNQNNNNNNNNGEIDTFVYDHMLEFCCRLVWESELFIKQAKDRQAIIDISKGLKSKNRKERSSSSTAFEDDHRNRRKFFSWIFYRFAPGVKAMLRAIWITYCNYGNLIKFLDLLKKDQYFCWRASVSFRFLETLFFASLGITPPSSDKDDRNLGNIIKMLFYYC